MNFCSAKKGTLQSFLIKKWTQQSLGGTLYNCVLDPTKLYNRHYKTMDITIVHIYVIYIWLINIFLMHPCCGRKWLIYCF